MDYLKKIEEFLCDEEKVVTYKWLSQNLKININHAKQLLALYLKNSKSDEFLVTYLISAKNDQGLSIFIATNENLDNIKSSFKDVSVLNVYSIQKKNTLPDVNNLYIVDKNNQRTYLGAVSTPECNEREKKPKGKIVSTTKIQEPKNKVNVSSNNRDKSQEEKNDSSNSKEKPNKEEIPKQTNKTKKPDGNLASFFNRQKTRNENKTVEVTDTAAKNDSQEERKEVPLKIVEEKSTDKNIIEKKKTTFEEKSTEKNVIEKKKTVSDTSNEKENKKKRNHKKNVNNQEKKRKRILQICDSDSSDDDIFGKEEEPNSPQKQIDDDVEMIPETPESQKTLNALNKKRIRKEVEKTFLDEEGFMITKKEIIYESGSDSEEASKDSLKKVDNAENGTSSKRRSEPLSNPVTKKQKTNSDSNKATKKDKKLPSPKKQASIMSFFKKKT